MAQLYNRVVDGIVRWTNSGIGCLEEDGKVFLSIKASSVLMQLHIIQLENISIKGSTGRINMALSSYNMVVDGICKMDQFCR